MVIDIIYNKISKNDSEWNIQQEDYFQSIENYTFWNVENLKYQRISKYFDIPILVISNLLLEVITYKS